MTMWRTSSHSESSDCVEADVLPASWRTSTASMSNGDCVEVFARWRKSTASGPDHDCVEVGHGTVVAVRDTKDRGGAWLKVTPAAWTAFMHRLKTGPRQA